jgi:hypothetical protein
MARPIFRTYNLCTGTLVIDEPGGVFDQGFKITFKDFDPIPSWFTLITDIEGDIIGWQIDATVAGSFEIEFVEVTNLSEVTKRLVINVGEEYCPEIFDVCCDKICNIGWWNTQGGFQNYVFEGVKTFTRTIGNRTEYKDINTVHYSKIENVHYGKRCSTRSIPKSHVKLILDSLYSSIQAYEYNSDTQNWDIPIIIEKSQYERYNSREKIFERDVVFLYAEEEVIQGQ